MEQSDLEKITELVTRQVLAALSAQETECADDVCGRTRVLIVGKARKELPEMITRRALLYDLEDYRKHGDILRYDRVYIASLGTKDLAEIALGISGSPASCAVIHALLEGIETLMPEDAPTYRRYEGKAGAAMFRLFEGYERTLRTFGVRTPAKERVYPELPSKPPKYAAPALNVPAGSARPNFSRLITEEEAERLIAQGDFIRLPADCIVTPLARDVFAAAGVNLAEE